jgi:uncharacterized membrane protein
MILPGLTLLLIGAACAALRVRVLPGALFLIFSLPLVVVPLTEWIGFWGALICSFVLLLALLKRSLLRAPGATGLAELLAVVLLWFPLHYLSSELWPEFYNIGERLRDFAVLAEVTENPLHPRDPWCHAFPLNYYIYWYRFGAVLKSAFGLTVAETYHLLVSFVPAVIFGCALYLFRTGFGASLPVGVVASAVLVFGSNLKGLQVAFTGRHWWSPSRAISIGITEFTSWSFLLGDLHPHYLSQMLPLFFLTLAWHVRQYSFILLGSFVVYVAMLTFAANSWDVVALGLIALPLGLSALMKGSRSAHGELCSIALLLALGALSLLSTANLQPVELTLRWLTSEHPRFSAFEFLSHWGGALLMVALSAIVAGPRELLRDKFLPLLLAGCSLQIIFVSVLFFDDAFGGEFERLNTIFKFYSSLWIPINLCGLIAAVRLWQWLGSELQRDLSIRVAIAGLVCISLSFFAHTAIVSRPNRPTDIIEPRREGLSLVEEPQLVHLLRESVVKGPVLEWNEPAYSDATTYCTLSGRGCYLGWQNHLRVYYKEAGEELSRRQEVINTLLYGEKSCEEKLALVHVEGIGAVVGPKTLNLSCFSTTREFNSLRVFIP